MDKIKFSHKEKNPIEIVRALVLEMLSNEEWQQFPSSTEVFDNKVEFVDDASTAKSNFLVLVHEIMWELIIQRVITPGSDSQNPELPFFRVTDYGRKVVAHGEFIPHDPSNYLEKYKKILVDPPDAVVFEYLKESLRNFNSGCYLSATMMLGIASERVFLILCETMLKSITNLKESKKFSNVLAKISMMAKFDFVRKKIEFLMSQKGKGFPKIQIANLLGIFEFIRVQRNDVGHPQENLQIPERDNVYVNLRIFPQYCKTVEEVKKYFINNKV